MTKNSILVNFFAGPGAGKTTLSLKLTYELKCRGFTCEYVPEYAKELVYAEDYKKLKKQEEVTGEQMRRIEIYRNKVDFIVTDSPVLLGMIYGKNNSDSLNGKILGFYNVFNNLNFYIKRNKPYEKIGRIQTETEALQKDEEVLNLLKTMNFPFEYIEYETPIDPYKLVSLCEKERFKIINH